MIIKNKPYFLTDDKWYYYNEDRGILELTDVGKANEKVVESYKQFYAYFKEKLVNKNERSRI